MACGGADGYSLRWRGCGHSTWAWRGEDVAAGLRTGEREAERPGVGFRMPASGAEGRAMGGGWRREKSSVVHRRRITGREATEVGMRRARRAAAWVGSDLWRAEKREGVEHMSTGG